MCLTRDDLLPIIANQIETLLKAGAKLIQLRSKSIPPQNLYKQAKEATELCKRYNCTLIINDDYKLANSIDADGVHVGLGDAPVKLIRKELQGKLIGKTVHTIEEANPTSTGKPDYVGLGPFRKFQY